MIDLWRRVGQKPYVHLGYLFGPILNTLTAPTALLFRPSQPLDVLEDEAEVLLILTTSRQNFSVMEFII